MTRINTNVSSLVGRNNLNRANASLSQALTRLSTGLRINTGKDDPAGLIASENLRSDITSIKRAISNTDRANQVIATADSALGQVSSLLNDIRGLVTESANAGALSDEQIAANQLQVDSSLEALNRIAQTTTFQGRRLLDGSLSFLTDAGAEFTRLSNLQIDQANLGATGEVGVEINVTAAATQASVAVDNLPDVTPTATASVDFDVVTTAGVGASATGVSFTAITADTGQGTATLGLTSQASGTFTIGTESVTIGAVAGGSFDGALGNGAITAINVDVDQASATAGNDVTVDLTGTTLTLTFDADAITVDDVINAINNNGSTGNVGTISYTGSIAASDFTSSTAGPGTTAIAADETGVTPDTALAGGGTETLTLVALEDTDADGAEISSGTAPTIVFTSNAAADSADYDESTNQLNVNINSGDTSDRTFQDLADLIVASGEFSVNGSTTTPTLTNGSFVLGGAGAGVDTNTGALTVTVDGTDATTTAVTIDIQALASEGTDGEIDIDFVEASLGASAGAVQIIGNATSGYTAQINTDNAGGVTIEQIETALETISEVDSVTITAGAGATFNAHDVAAINELPTTTTSLSGGVDEVVTTSTIDLVTAVGVTGDIDIDFSEVNLSGTGTNVVDNGSGSYTVQIDNSVGVAVDDIRAAIATIAEIGSATFASGSPTTTTYNAANDTEPTALNIVGVGSAAATNGIDQDVVLQLAGSTGAEVLSFEAGTSLELLVNGINAVSDATGVTAEANGTNDGLVFTSSGYGSGAIVDVDIIEEDASGAFTAALDQGARAIGSDIVATVNGITATGDGNRLSINTATLDLSTSVETDFVGAIEFDITGGGALFQLGPDVVSNQQARLGITSVNTAALGGASGRLYQLGTGGSSQLSGDTTAAAQIVGEAIDQITSLRGRLGAFQRTTLETNKNALNDTLTNLTEAESTVRDADFAAETAELTRSQILVQSGTRVLAISNQNPQNVLALLG
ncbi:flagellin [Aeoliella sp.]|uniref:flagellin N-terminal helical domain-containing protein n=1 Tax=Aeoliella sp. TaxID=2795800 RepID=UPI003CCC3C94